MQTLLWDPKREFFLIMFKNDEANEKDFPGKPIKAGTLIYEDGPFAGSLEGRELIGYVPWQFNLPDPGFESAWKFLMDSNYFFAPFGPSFVGRNDPTFVLKTSCCWWSGQSWPYATTQTLKALANLLQNYRQNVITRGDYVRLLRIYALTHRKAGKPYIAEAAHPDTGSWEGHDGYNHSEHYFHSGFNDLIITGLVGVKPCADDVLEIDPLAPSDWPWFALDELPYRGHRVSVVWDKDGSRYRRGAGLRILVDGKQAASSDNLGPLQVRLPARAPAPAGKPPVNFLVNNDGDYFPRLTASFTSDRAPLEKANDGNYWYHLHPPNRWTSYGSTNSTDWMEVDFGEPREIGRIELCLYDDHGGVQPPAAYTVQSWTGSEWRDLPDQVKTPARPAGSAVNTITFPQQTTTRFRVVFTHNDTARSGVTEILAWKE